MAVCLANLQAGRLSSKISFRDALIKIPDLPAVKP